jgi:hypothetical protein
MKESKDKVVWHYSLKFLQFSRYETIMRTSFLHPDHALVCFAADINGHEVGAAAARMRCAQQVLQGRMLHVVAMSRAPDVLNPMKSREGKDSGKV